MHLYPSQLSGMSRTGTIQATITGGPDGLFSARPGNQQLEDTRSREYLAFKQLFLRYWQHLSSLTFPGLPVEEADVVSKIAGCDQGHKYNLLPLSPSKPLRPQRAGPRSTSAVRKCRESLQIHALKNTQAASRA